MRVAGREAAVLLSCCGLAALRVFLLSAAFPLFDNVDEPAHFDLALKYSLGRLPKGVETYAEQTARLLAAYASPEYFMPEKAAGRFEPPPWSRMINQDSTQPPLYYLAAGAWYRLARTLDPDEGRAIYAIRFLNIAVIALSAGAAYFFLIRAYPGRPFLRLGVPALLAFLPQDFFYSIGNDVPMPLLFAAAFYCLLEVVRAERPSHFLCVGAGILSALTVLNKLSGLPILGILAVAAIRLSRRRRGRGAAALCCAALLPLLAWGLRNHIVMGDFTGTAQKARAMTWTLQPFGAMLRHPIFTPRGAWFFIDELLKSFWRGEFFWRGERLWAKAPACEMFFTLSSLALLAVSGLGLRGKKRSAESSVDAWSFLAVGLSILFLVAVSLAYDFGECAYPSRELPYMFSGRLISGAAIPFFALYLGGLESLLSRWRRSWLPWAFLCLIALLLGIEQARLAWPAFHSVYNWYHLP